VKPFKKVSPLKTKNMKKILGLDLGTNSIGWALVEMENKIIDGLGSRIIPMSQDILGEFDKGNSVSQTAERTGFRGTRHLRERHLLRRERLHRVLNILGFLPEQYKQYIDFEAHPGQLILDSEPKLVYRNNLVTQKPEFIFKSSFEEMVNDFKQSQPQLFENNKKIPYDWTIYYLRKKALTHRIEKEELAWLLLNFNQKRGYYQLRGEEDEDATKTAQTRIYFVTERIESIIDTNELYKGLKIFKIQLSNGETGKYFNRNTPNWIGQERNIIVTIDTDKDGNDRIDKDGSVSRKFSIPTDEDWEKKWKLIKIKTEKEITDSHKTIGAYIYDTLLAKPNQKIRGKLVRTIERKFYKNELESILTKQKEFHPELSNNDLYLACLEELYEHNESHKNNIGKKDFTHLFVNDIIFYQRPLKSKKSLISNCTYESRVFIKDGKKEIEPIKCIAKSHPLFLEFRLWQFVQNLKIYEREKIVNGKTETDVNVTVEFLKTEDDWVALFDWLNERKEIDQKAFLKYPAFNLKKDSEKYRWNYVEDKIYPCNETRWLIINRLEKTKNVPEQILKKEIAGKQEYFSLNHEFEEALWHILYSVEDKHEHAKALKTFASKYNLGEDFEENFRKLPPFKKEYGSYSAKAIKKLLPLMRMGKYWKEEQITEETKRRINSIIERLESVNYNEQAINSISDDYIPKQVLKSFANCKHPFYGLNTYQACYAVYGRHSESGDVRYWKTPSDIELYLKNEFKQHSLRNPIIEQVITETLRVVKDIWKYYGNNQEGFFNEIHIELGREMKNPADKRKQMTNTVTENENTNLRIKALLMELLNDKTIENVRPYSPSQQEILKIYEEGVLGSSIEIPEEILKISKQNQPSNSELTRYKLWLDQKYRSPYTGEFIPLSKLFTSVYEIEHIIPQSRYFDDSFSNKVICESEVNKDKDNSTAYEYIKNNEGKKIELSFGKEVTLLKLQAYEENIKQNFAKNRNKMKKLLMDDIPDSFINRQLNDSRYISKVVKGLLSNIVREEGEQESTSKNVLSSNGSITTILKQDWGLNDVWNDIITPRFERLNELTNSNNFGEWTNKEGKKVFQTQVPLELQKGFSKKRIDHRHHTMDALVIACATRNHINFLNNEHAKADKKDSRYELRNLLCYKKYNGENKDNYKWVFTKPWETFTQDGKDKLLTTIVSFKQNLRVINKTVNKYQKWVTEDGILKKKFEKQEKGESWAIRKPLHKDTVSGSVNLRFKKTVQLSAALESVDMIVDKSLKTKIKGLITQNEEKKNILKYFKNLENKWNDEDISRIEIYYFDNENVATRKKIDESFDAESIKNITDTSIQKILLNHLNQDKYQGKKDANGKDILPQSLAFSPDGLEELNNNISSVNNKKWHQPIVKARVFEPKGNKFNVGHEGNKKTKFVEAAKGTNLFFAIYTDQTGKRNYESVPLNIVIERLKQGLNAIPENNEKGDKLLFSLSPNDLVYIPNIEEQESSRLVDFKKLSKEQGERIYKVVSFSGNQCFFVRNDIANTIVNKVEFSALNKMERAIDNNGTMIKEVCWKLKLDRLGNIIEANGKKVN
jgi:CRISPR-associated endonuclease Csn1